MLKIINDLQPFFEDCYREIGVREYSRLMKITPPTASKILKEFGSEKLLNGKKDKLYLLFRANRESINLRDLSRIYWREKLKKLTEKIDDELHEPLIILFGSLSKLEARKDSDIDIAIISPSKKKIDFGGFEKTYGRKIQDFRFDSLDKIAKDLNKNILQGFILNGEIYYGFAGV